MPSAGSTEPSKLPGIGGVFNSLNINLYAYAQQSPITFHDPDGRHSSKNYPGFDPVHQNAIKNVLGDQVSKEGIKIMQDRQVAMDEYQSPEKQYTHAMMDSRAKDSNSKPITREQQIGLGENFVRTSLESSMNAERKVDAFSALGDAIHTMQDATSPVHAGFQDWDKQSGRKHVYSENRYPAKGTSGRVELEGATQWAYDIYMGKAQMPDAFFDPKTGSLNLPAQYRIPEYTQ